MDARPRTTRTWLLIWLGGLGAFTALAFFFASAQYVDYLYRTGEANWGGSVRFALVQWWPWVLIAPGVLWLGWRFGFRRGQRLASALVHGPMSLLGAFLFVLVWASLVPLLMPSYDVEYSWTYIQSNMRPGRLASGFTMYWLIVAAALGLETHRRAREREVRASELEARLARAQLQVLESQLHPHFLFNTLHAISTLMHRDVDAADRMMSRLSDLLRLTLEQFGVQTVSLRQELDFLRRYLDIEQIRFGERLSVKMDIDDALLDATVPRFILQPLVENAVRHGISPRSAGGTITLRGRREDGRLALEVCDDGVGMPDDPEAASAEGVGLANTRARLHQLYGGRGELQLTRGATGGLTVRLSIPCGYGPSTEETSHEA